MTRPSHPACIAATVAATMVGAAGADSTAVFSAADDYSIASNPAGAWTYGYSQGVGGALIPFEHSGSGSGIVGWFENISLGAPGSAHNTTASVVTTGTVQYQPGQAIFHPGPSGQACVYRFTAPYAGTYQLDAAFVGADTWGTSTVVHILVDGSSIFSGTVSGFGPGTGPTFATALELELGSTVDFAVSTTNSFYNDSTGIEATLAVNDIPCQADLDGDGTVGAADLAMLLGAWSAAQSPADLDADGTVGAADLALLLGAWGFCR